MEKNNKKKWYQKGGYWITGAVVIVIIASFSGGNNSQQGVQSNNLNRQYTSPPYVDNSVNQTSSVNVNKIDSVQQTTQSNTDLSNNNYYTNVDGNSVHSPAYAPRVPAGATARCRDGTYSFSQNRSGTCSHHGGVAQWL